MTINTGIKEAVISECGKYRYALTRKFGKNLNSVVWVMLNPSTADAKEDDPTIRRIVEFSRTWGYGRAVVLNLFAYRSTSPKEMKEASEPVGPENWDHIRSATHGGWGDCLVVCAWGNHGAHLKQDQCFRNFVYNRPIHHLGLTKQGQPKHPLYLPSDTTPVLWQTTQPDRSKSK